MSHDAPSSSALSLTSIGDLLALTLQCGDNLAAIQHNLAPSLRRLAADSNIRADQILAANAGGDRDALAVLDPKTHTLSYLYILTARFRILTAPEYSGVHLTIARQFVDRFNAAQARCAGYKVAQLARRIAELGDRMGDASAVLPLLEVLFVRFTEERRHALSALHPVVAYQYLKAAQYQPAVETVLGRELVDVDSHALPNHTDVLEYYYYAGMILAKLKMHEEAIDAFETCVSVPTAVVSAIQMDAYKKLVLVQLLARGKTSPPPRYTSQMVIRTFQQTSSSSSSGGGSAYLLFAMAYESRERDCVAELEAVVNEQAQWFTQDGNFGLVWQCLEMHRLRRMQRLAEVYSCLTLRDAADWLGIQGDQEERVRGVREDVETLVEKGWASATLLPPTAMVAAPWGGGRPDDESEIIVFHEPSKTFDDQATVTLLTNKIREWEKVQRLIEARERGVASSVEFLKKQAQTSRNRFSDIQEGEFDDDVFAS
ncbi:hypothetical protein ACQY0O_000741 [Thecaphora frezii]